MSKYFTLGLLFLFIQLFYLLFVLNVNTFSYFFIMALTVCYGVCASHITANLYWDKVTCKRCLKCLHEKSKGIGGKDE